MKVYFGQIYIEPGVEFPFSHVFQRHLSQEITALIVPSPRFLYEYGNDFNLVFNVSAKRAIQDNEIKGPTVFRETSDVEYTVFLPFDVIVSNSEVPKCALEFLLKGAYAVFKLLDIDASKIVEKETSLIERICSDPTMFKVVS